MTWRRWSAAMAESLYGPDGFYRLERPAAHFRTSVHASPLFAAAVLRLAEEVAAEAVVDVGAGSGELLAAVDALAPGRFALAAVEVAPRPPRLPDAVGWYADLADIPPVDGLLLANEWLDNVPVDVAVAGRYLEVDERGAERPGDPVEPADAAWLARWWPGPGPAEVGRRRDEAWAAAVARLRRGVAVAVDYAVPPGGRPGGTLAAYRAGRQVPAVPDGGRDLTAHVLLDACAAAGREAGAEQSVLTTQRAALRALGVSGARPPLELAHRDPASYATALQHAAAAAELTAPDGLGGFGWLVQAVGCALPGPLRDTMRP